MRRVICDYCQHPAELVTGADLYPHRPDLEHLKFYRCVPCKAHVGCHRRGKGAEDGARPLGRLANEELRRAKNAAHAAFDPIWKSKQMSRTQAYRWLAAQLGVTPANCHIGMFDVDGCRAVVAAVQARSAT